MYRSDTPSWTRSVCTTEAIYTPTNAAMFEPCTLESGAEPIAAD